MTTIYVLYNEEKIRFFSSLDNIGQVLGVNLEAYEFYEFEEGCAFERLDYEENVIHRYKFNDCEDISFMLCTGPSSECFFLIKKNSFEFYKEMNKYMYEFYLSTYVSNDRLVCKNEDTNDFKCVSFVYMNGDEDMNLMKFSFITDIRF